MKKLTLIFTLLVSTVMFSSPSYSKWTKVTENARGNTYYVDFERIRKVDGYVYYWELMRFQQGSIKSYHQGDCKLFRQKDLSISIDGRAMGNGIAKSFTYNDNNWEYPPPNSSIEIILKKVCSR
jgi:hypothetical protein